MHAVAGLDVDQFALGDVDDHGPGVRVPRELRARLNGELATTVRDGSGMLRTVVALPSSLTFSCASTVSVNCARDVSGSATIGSGYRPDQRGQDGERGQRQAQREGEDQAGDRNGGPTRLGRIRVMVNMRGVPSLRLG